MSEETQPNKDMEATSAAHASHDAHDHHEDESGEYGDGSAQSFAVVYTCIALAFVFGILIFG